MTTRNTPRAASFLMALLTSFAIFSGVSGLASKSPVGAVLVQLQSPSAHG